MKIFILFLFIFIFISSAQSSQKNNLNNLFDQLQNINNSKSAAILEQKIWSIWNEHPSDIKLTEKLEFGRELIQYGNYDYALKVFDNILATDPEWSEAWNKRATVFFLMKKYTRSLNDIEKVLKIESRHFGALSGQARIFIKLQEYEKAIISLKKALEFYPSFRSGELILEIERLIREKTI
jgi:tetratricopeptide (TPR) repeat protein